MTVKTCLFDVEMVFFLKETEFAKKLSDFKEAGITTNTVIHFFLEF